MSTVRDLIKGSLRLIGAISTGETPSADEQADALSVFNQMLDSWSTEGLNIYAKVREEFALTPGTGSYTIGPTGTFNTTRPIRIETAMLEVQTGTPFELPVDIVTQKQWAAISNKGATSEIPYILYPEGTFPLETLNVWPVPSAANKLVLYSEKALTTFTSVSTTLTFPPGYEKAIRYNLAIELCPEYGKTATAEVIAGALESKANIKRLNIKPAILGCDAALLSLPRTSSRII